MSFFSRLFKSNEPETLEQKISKVEAQPQQELVSTALQSEVEQVRVVAINKLDFCSDLVKIATGSEQSNQLVTAARKRIGHLLDREAISVQKLEQEIPDKSTLLSLCAYSNKASVSLVERLNDEPSLLDVAKKGATTHIRQAAAERIETKEALEDLAKTAKNKDKSVYKIVKSKLDIFKAEKAKEAELDAQVDAACAQAEQLAKRDVDDIFHARKKQIETTWLDLANQAKNEAKERFQSALATCQQKLDDILTAEKEKAEQETADKEAKKDVHSALHATQVLIAQLYMHTSSHELEEKLNEELKKAEQQQQTALKEASERGLNIQQEKSRADELIRSAQSLLEKLKHTGPVPKLLEEFKEAKDETSKALKHQLESILVYAKTLKEVPTPEIVISSKETISEWSKSIREQAEHSKTKIRETAELIRKADWAISKGYVGRARAIFRDLEEKVKHLDQIPSHIENKYEDVKESMKKLGDWHEFAVTPKKEALVKKMQSLVDSTLHPQDLAHKIHELQDSWKELCKGGQNQDESLWDKFHEASQTSYERCKTYFDEQTKTRNANAELRLALIKHLEQYEAEYNWDEANWKEVESTLKISRDTWQTYWPVPRKQIKELQQTFDGILDRIFSKRNAEFEANKTKKQNVVDQSKALKESENIGNAIDSAKRLQSQWQAIGRCKRQDDQELWKEFRANCDAIFEKRDQENEAQKEERNTAKEQAEQVINQLEQILESKGSDFFSARSQTLPLTEAFQAVGELPRDSAKGINNRYHKALDDIEARVDQERKEATTQVWSSVFNLADDIRSYELKIITGDDTTKLKASIEDTISNAGKWPGDTLNVLQQRLEAAETLDGSATLINNELLRMLCIRSEILTDNDSPGDEKALRMTYQVNQLQHGFGQGSDSSKQTRTEILTEWIQTPAVSDELYPALLQRFSKCWELS